MLLFQDSCDHYATAQMTRKWTSETETSIISGQEVTHYRATIVPLAGRCSSQALRVKQTSMNNALAAGPTLVVFPSTTDGVVGCAVKASLFTQPMDLIRLYDNSGSLEYPACQLRVLLEQNGTIQVIRGANAYSHSAAFTGGGNSVRALRPRDTADILCTASIALSTASYYYLELVFDIDSSSGAVELFIDSVSRASATGVDTDPAGTGTWGAFSPGRVQQHGDTAMNAATYLDFDDFYVLDTSGATCNARLGDQRIQANFPSTDAVAVGTNQGWTPSTGTDHGDMVDDTTPDDDSTYISGVTAGLRDTFNYPAIGTLAGTITAVSVLPCAKKDDSGLKELETVVRSGGSNYDGTAQSVSTESYRYYPQIYEVNPATGVPFTVAGLNAAEFGVKVQT